MKATSQGDIRKPKSRRPRVPAKLEHPAQQVQESSSSPELADLADGINRAFRLGNLAANQAVEHARRVGELLDQAKSRVGHGRFQQWVRENCVFGYRMAARYLEVFRRRPEFEETPWSKVTRESLLPVSGLLKMLPRKQAGSGSDEGRATGPPLAPGEFEALDRSPADSNSTRPTGQAGRTEPTAASPGLLLEGDGAAIDPSIPASDDVERPAAGNATSGIAIVEDGPQGAPGLPSRRRGGRLRDKLEAVGNVREFDGDAAVWHLLRPVVPAIIAHIESTGNAGPYAEVILDFVRARRPEEWSLCKNCGGSGRAMPDRATCGGCCGGGYRIDLR
jgi:hypothetical protein